MVFFTCNACGESLKKNQVEKHYMHKCRRCEVLTCVDCHKDFPGDSYATHTKCITEDEKYSAKGWQPKASANKGERKQQNWIENLHTIIAEKTRSGDLDGDVRSLLDTIMAHENIPRKRQKFTNFIKNIVRGIRPATIDNTWELFEQALKKPAPAADPPKKSDEKSNGKSEEESEEKPDKMEVEDDETVDEKVESRLGVNMFQGTKSLEEDAENGTESSKDKKKKKKKAKKNGISEAEDEISGKENDGKTKKRKREEETLEEDEEQTAQTPSKKKSKKAAEISTPGSKFIWEDTMESLLEKKGEMKLERLKKKVVNEYMAQFPDTFRDRQSLSVKVEKKLSKNKRFKVLKGVVKLSTSR